MRKICKVKDYEPASLTRWKRHHKSGHYNALKSEERQAIRAACVEEQYFLCAYCCKPISLDNNGCHNEHVQPKGKVKALSLDFGNIVASCNAKQQCGQAHGSQHLPLTPLMDACETDLQFSLSGRVTGATPDAKESIRVLNLGDADNNRALRRQRKNYIDSMLFINGIEPEKGLEDNELLELLLDELSQPQDGKLAPFAPVLVNVIRQWIK